MITNLISTKLKKQSCRLEVLDLMDDANRIGENIEFMRKFMRDLDRMNEEVNWVNHEESLFGFPISSYPRILELQDQTVLPMYNLIYKGYKWQRYVNCWLDGPFEFLVPTEVEAKTNDFFGEFGKIGKTFRTKMKMQIAMNYPTL